MIQRMVILTSCWVFAAIWAVVGNLEASSSFTAASFVILALTAES